MPGDGAPNFLAEEEPPEPPPAATADALRTPEPRGPDLAASACRAWARWKAVRGVMERPPVENCACAGERGGGRTEGRS